MLRIDFTFFTALFKRVHFFFHSKAGSHFIVLVMTLILVHNFTSYVSAYPQENEPGENNADTDTFFVKEFILASDVVEREPVEIRESYTMSDARAWCYTRIHNSQKIQDVIFEWYYEGSLYFKMNSKIGISPNWRTYSSVGLQPGSWKVLLKDSRGNTLEEISFLVSE